MRISAPDGIRPAPTQRSNPIPLASRISLLVGIKVLHTVIWLFFAACILAIPFAAHKSVARAGAPWTGKIVVDAMNTYGVPPEDLNGLPSSLVVASLKIAPIWAKSRGVLLAFILGSPCPIPRPRIACAICSK